MLTLNSYAKVNLYLEVLKRREDGYHEIKTVFERINLSDKIILKPRPDGKIRIYCDEKDVPTGETNLAYKSAKLLQDEFNINKGVDIKIIKRIPVGAGLGGGSSNAAATLLGLNRLWKLGLKREQLSRLAARIGSDCPFFVYDIPFGLGRGRGERIEPISSLKRTRLWHVLLVPKIKVLTPRIYKEWDKKNTKAALTRPEYNVNILTSALRKTDLLLTGKSLFNSLEPVSFALQPSIGYAKKKLVRFGMEAVLMSGSGPAVFGVVACRKRALTLYSQAKEDRRFRPFVVRTK